MVTVTVYRLDGSVMDIEFTSARWSDSGMYLICSGSNDEGDVRVEFPIHRIAEVGRSA